MTMDFFKISNWTMILTAWAAGFMVALWLSMVIWTYRDIRSRVRDPLLRVLAVIVVALLFLPGLLVYLILRPMRTMEDEYQQSLEEEALLQTIEEMPLCPGCGRRVKDNWLFCPNCQTKLRKSCHQCGKLMELPWNLCPYCGTPAPGMRRENLSLEDALRSLPVEPSKPEEHAQLEETPPDPEEPEKQE